MLNPAAQKKAYRKWRLFFFFTQVKKKHFKKGLSVIGQHNEPSLADIRKFIHRLALEDGFVQDAIFMPQYDK